MADTNESSTTPFTVPLVSNCPICLTPIPPKRSEQGASNARQLNDKSKSQKQSPDDDNILLSSIKTETERSEEIMKREILQDFQDDLFEEEPSPTSPAPGTDKLTQATFLLRDVLDLPQAFQKRYKKTLGPLLSNWLKLCLECTEAVREVDRIFHKFLQVQREYEEAKAAIKDTMKRTSEEVGGGCGLDILDEARGMVAGNNKRKTVARRRSASNFSVHRTPHQQSSEREDDNSWNNGDMVDATSPVCFEEEMDTISASPMTSNELFLKCLLCPGTDDFYTTEMLHSHRLLEHSHQLPVCLDCRLEFDTADSLSAHHQANCPRTGKPRTLVNIRTTRAYSKDRTEPRTDRNFSNIKKTQKAAIRRSRGGRRRLKPDGTKTNQHLSPLPCQTKKEKPKHICTHCNKECQTLLRLQRHMLSKHGVSLPLPPQSSPGKRRTKPKKTYICPHCGKDCGQKFNLNQHMVLVHKVDVPGMKYFKCPNPNCSFRCMDTFHLEAHERVCKVLRKCAECQLVFSSTKDLKSHQIFEHGADPKGLIDVEGKETTLAVDEMLPCVLCGKSFPCEKTLRNHEKYTHELASLLKCHECPEAFKTRDKLEYHLARWHSINLEDFKCLTCGHFCSNRAARRRHICGVKEVRSRTRHSCTNCEKNFSSKQALQCHVLTVHEKRFEFHCDLDGCGYVSNDKSHFAYHRAAVHNIGDFHCEFESCGKAFSSESFLQKHRMYKHEGVPRPKTHICSECGAAFVNSTDLTQHTRINHSATKKFICNDCELAFPTSGYLSRHKKTHQVQVNAPNPKWI